jgi:hypothetical protein
MRCELDLNELQGLAHSSTGSSFPLSVSFHQSSIPIFILTLLLSGHAGETWDPSNKAGVLYLFCAMGPFESLVKPTDPFERVV